MSTKSVQHASQPNGKPIYPAIEAEQPADVSPWSPSYIFGAVQRNNRLFILSTLVMMGWVSAYALFVHKPTFSSRSTVIIKEAAMTKRFVESDQYYAPQNISSTSTNPVLNTLELLHSKTVVDGLYDFLAVHYPKELQRMHIRNVHEWEESIGDASSIVKAKNKVGTDFITINFAWSNPEIAQQGLEAVLKSFKTASLNLNKAEQSERAIYLQNQANELAMRLQNLRDQKSHLKTNAMTLNVDQQNINLDTDRLQLEQQLNEIKAKMHGTLAEKSRYQSLLGANSSEALLATSIGNNAQLEKLKLELYTLNQKAAELSEHYTENSPNVVTVQSEIDQVKKNINEELRRSLGRRYSAKSAALLSIGDSNRSGLVNNMVQAEAQAINLKNQAATLESRLAQLNTKIKDIPVLESRMSSINDQESTLSRALQNLRERILETNLKEAQTLSNVFIVDPPEMPAKSEFPQAIHLLLMGLVAAVATGIATVLLKVRLFPSTSSARRGTSSDYQW